MRFVVGTMLGTVLLGWPLRSRAAGPAAAIYPQGCETLDISLDAMTTVDAHGTRRQEGLQFRAEGGSLVWDGLRFSGTRVGQYGADGVETVSVKGELTGDRRHVLWVEAQKEMDGRTSIEKPRYSIRLINMGPDPSELPTGRQCQAHVPSFSGWVENKMDPAKSYTIVGIDWQTSEKMLGWPALSINFRGNGCAKRARPSAVAAEPPACTDSPEARLEEILRRYRAVIPRGPLASGIANNVASIFDAKLEKFRCGGYQNTVLDFLDGLRRSKNKSESCLLEPFDYGPIEIGVGFHQAVVIYGKGETWKLTGTVLDPWFNQRPEVFSMPVWQWKSCWATGSSGGCTVHGASWLGEWTLYPTVGGPYPDGVASRPHPKKRVGDVAVNCPLGAWVSDGNGHVTGFHPQGLRNEVPGVDIVSVPLADGTVWTELAFDPRPDLTLNLLSIGTGPATLIARPGRGGVVKYEIAVRAGEAFSLSLGTPKADLTTPSGPVKAMPARRADATAATRALKFAQDTSTQSAPAPAPPPPPAPVASSPQQAWAPRQPWTPPPPMARPLPAPPPPVAMPPANLLSAPRWRMRQWIGRDTWDWLLTRRPNEPYVFDARAHNNQNGLESQHVFQVRSVQNGRIEMYRTDAGLYFGTLAPDGQSVNGTTNFTPAPEGWTIILAP